ncbi:DUF1844 domain-containing protein [Algisphaera agarilytica]|uniref:DUF1844 domain-containing protein n=1 Tax=Algisphaera agarilytica TaxID=1385975 RepID=A0A7X0LMJ4_9BACT|nr:DUF1844 domain-containing protein [Algisphaera agarilytica]MBB6431088.1 hypothetical protein [Algisphaera agarilytica]
MSDTDDTPKIQIDSDWKAQAQAEKEKLAAASKAEPGGDSPENTDFGGPGGEALPPANFETLLSSFVTQALFAMGAIPDPQTGQPALHLDLARYQIDMLGVLEEKTKGNLTEDEEKMLAGTMYELRTRYVQVANAQRGA